MSDTIPSKSSEIEGEDSIAVLKQLIADIESKKIIAIDINGAGVDETTTGCLFSYVAMDVGISDIPLPMMEGDHSLNDYSAAVFKMIVSEIEKGNATPINNLTTKWEYKGAEYKGFEHEVHDLNFTYQTNKHLTSSENAALIESFLPPIPERSMQQRRSSRLK